MTEISPELKILYIASPSRSGSTILEHSLGALEGVVNVGELRRLKSFTNMNKGELSDPKNKLGCTCGESIQQCDFWQKVEKESGIDFSKASLSSQMGFLNRNFLKLIYCIFGHDAIIRISMYYSPFKREMEISENYYQVYSAIKNVSGADYIVDSSKIIYQYMILKSLHPDNMHLVALFRDGRAVSKSMIKGNRKESFKGRISSLGKYGIYRSAVLSWVKSTLQIYLCYANESIGNRIFIKYEKFCESPGGIIADLFRKFGKLETPFPKNPDEETAHTIGGSPSRFDVSFKEIKLDESWRETFDDSEKKIFNRYAGMLNRKLGYR